MRSNSAFGSLARKAIGWAVVAVVAILLFKIVFAIVAGFVQLLLGIAFLLLIGYAVIWALRRL
jgi:uncharacterized membrane protein (DUF485 family)